MKMIRSLNLCCALLIGALLSVAGHSASAANCTLTIPAAPGNQITPSITDYYPDANSASSLFTITVPTNSPIPAAVYSAWCVDGNTSIDPAQSTVPGTPYFGNLYSTTDSNALLNLPNHGGIPPVGPPPVTSFTTWNEINYILNHRAGYFYWDVQAAINTLVGGPAITSGYPYPPSNLGSISNLVGAAVSNAYTWAPQCGDKVGVLFVVAGTNAEQILILEVPCCNLQFVTVPANTNLGCNPLAASLPTGSVDTNLVYATSCCGPVTVTSSFIDAKVNCTTTRFITYTATDAVGNTKTYVQTVTWTTNTNLPTILGVPTGGNLGYNPTNLPTDASLKALLSATAGCSGLATITVSHLDSGTPCASVRTFNISAFDACGNTATAQVVYTYVIDTNAPVIVSVPSGTNFGCAYTTLPTTNNILTNIVATDNCTVVSTNIISSSVTNGSIVTLTFTVTVTDEAGNVSKPATVVYVYTLSTGPSLICAGDITITGTDSSPSVTGIPTLTDACGNPIACTNVSITYLTNFWNIYQDSFVNSPGCLNGRVPDIANLVGQKWTAASSWNVVGSQAVSSNANANAFLPLPIEQGVLYQVSADVECIAGPGTTPASDWVALGFANGYTTSGAWYSVNNSEGWELIRNAKNTNSGQTFFGPGVSGGANDGFYPTNLTHYSVIVDTRPTNPAAWTFAFYANGQVVTPTTAFGGNGPTITTVGFGEYCCPISGAVCHVKNFAASYGIPGYVTNSASCSNLTYSDMVVSNTCAGLIHIVRTWTGHDNQGRTATCTQNIYEKVPLRAITFVPTTTSLGCSPSTLPTSTTVASLVIGYSGLSATNITYVTSTNGCNVTRTFTVTVSDSCGDVSPAATLVYTWVNATPAVGCWVCGPATGTCLSLGSYTCLITNLGNCAFSSCTVTACGQTFTCPALNPGQGCSITIPHTFQTCDLGTFVCQPVCSAVAATACAPACSAQSSCKTTVCGTPCCKVTVSGPPSGKCYSQANYICYVTNTGTAPFTACTVTACGQTFNCPTLNPGESCSIPVSHTFQPFEVGTYNCQATVAANCKYSSSPTCSSQATYSHPVYWW